MINLKRFTLLIVTFFLVLQIPTPQALAQVRENEAPIDAGIRISPIKFEYNGSRGGVIEDKMLIENATYSDKTIYISTLDFVEGDEDGVPKYLDTHLPETTSLGSWMQFYTKNEDGTETPITKITLKEHETFRFNFRVNIPLNAEPGAHYSSIVTSYTDPNAEPVVENGNVSFQHKQAAIVMLNLDGDAIRTLTIDSFYTYDKFSKDKKEQKLFEWMPVSFHLNLHNEGNVFLKPAGNIYIKNTKGDVIDTIQVNEKQGNILNNSYRPFDIDWNSSMITRESVLDENGNPETTSTGATKTRVHFDNYNLKNFRMGKYIATVTTLYLDADGNKSAITSEIEFWVFPWKIILILLLTITTIIFGIIKYRQRRNRVRA